MHDETVARDRMDLHPSRRQPAPAELWVMDSPRRLLAWPEERHPARVRSRDIGPERAGVGDWDFSKAARAGIPAADAKAVGNLSEIATSGLAAFPTDTCRAAVKQMNTRSFPRSADASRRTMVSTFFKAGCRSKTLCHNHFARLQSA
jgi:hypothetical protein